MLRNGYATPSLLRGGRVPYGTWILAWSASGNATTFRDMVPGAPYTVFKDVHPTIKHGAASGSDLPIHTKGQADITVPGLYTFVRLGAAIWQV
jgi:hypothetical protein